MGINMVYKESMFHLWKIPENLFCVAYQQTILMGINILEGSDGFIWGAAKEKLLSLGT
jgi:hypothetical protein